MQKLAAYLLERFDDMEWAEARAAEARHLQGVVTSWLAAKGASAIAPTGTYQPEDGSVGTFRIEEAVDGERGWWMLQLDEVTGEGRRFSVSVSITSGTNRVSGYVTLATGWTRSHIMPVSVDPRCPRIIRELLSLPGRWYHGSSTLRPLQAISGFDDGEALAAEIEHRDRTVPFVVVSTDEGKAILPELDIKMAYDLAGLANVVTIDEDASWALTDVLGADFSCYWGAVRLYWPHFSSQRDCYFHPLWTGGRLQASGYDPFQTRDRLRRQLRGLIFRAAALSVIRPPEIEEVRDSVSRRTVTTLRERATSLEDYEKLADSYARANDGLREENARLSSLTEDLEAQVAKLEGDRLALQAHLSAAKAPSQGEFPQQAEIAPAETGDSATGEPRAGDVRFYKKVYSRPTHDVLVRVLDCGCNTWETSHGADKARKGIAKLESNRSDWSTMQHCASCTGGGMWKVRW